MSYAPTIASMVDGVPRTPIAFNYAGDLWALVPKDAASVTTPPELRIHGVGLSQAGRELLPVISLVPDEEYTKRLSEYFESLGFVMTRARADEP